MTNQHPITPPPELVRQWENEYLDNGKRECHPKRYIATQAAHWGADMELEACCEWIADNSLHHAQSDLLNDLRAARRPKPQSLAEEALDQLSSIQIDLTRYGMGISVETIRHALERLQQLDENQ